MKLIKFSDIKEFESGVFRVLPDRYGMIYMAITMKDVARLSGVSHQTVSRVINDNPAVAPDTRKKVLDSIEKLKYYPNRMAQNLQRDVVNAIGLSIPFSTRQIQENHFFAEVIGSISNVCTKKGVCLNIFSYDESSNDIEMFIRLYKERTISGLILTCPGLDEKNIISLKYNNIPFVVIGRPAVEYDINYVDVDNMKLAYDCTKYLIGLGHRRIALLNGPSFMTYSQDIHSGYKKALQEAGIPFNPDIVIETNLLEEDAQESTMNLLEQEQCITAAFSANDYLALGVMKVASEKGLTIPGDISLVAGSQSLWNSFTTPALTSVYTDNGYEGELAAELLFDLIGGRQEKAKKIIVTSELIVRRSCRSLQT